jgi:hypothetical protein
VGIEVLPRVKKNYPLSEGILHGGSS